MLKSSSSNLFEISNSRKHKANKQIPVQHALHTRTSHLSQNVTKESLKRENGMAVDAPKVFNPQEGKPIWQSWLCQDLKSKSVAISNSAIKQHQNQQTTVRTSSQQNTRFKINHPQERPTCQTQQQMLVKDKDADVSTKLSDAGSSTYLQTGLLNAKKMQNTCCDPNKLDYPKTFMKERPMSSNQALARHRQSLQNRISTAKVQKFPKKMQQPKILGGSVPGQAMTAKSLQTSSAVRSVQQSRIGGTKIASSQISTSNLATSDQIISFNKKQQQNSPKALLQRKSSMNSARKRSLENPLDEIDDSVSEINPTKPQEANQEINQESINGSRQDLNNLNSPELGLKNDVSVVENIYEDYSNLRDFQLHPIKVNVPSFKNYKPLKARQTMTQIDFQENACPKEFLPETSQASQRTQVYKNQEIVNKIQDHKVGVERERYKQFKEKQQSNLPSKKDSTISYNLSSHGDSTSVTTDEFKDKVLLKFSDFTFNEPHCVGNQREYVNKDYYSKPLITSKSSKNSDKCVVLKTSDPQKNLSMNTRKFAELNRNASQRLKCKNDRHQKRYNSIGILTEEHPFIRPICDTASQPCTISMGKARDRDTSAAFFGKKDKKMEVQIAVDGPGHFKCQKQNALPLENQMNRTQGNKFNKDAVWLNYIPHCQEKVDRLRAEKDRKDLHGLVIFQISDVFNKKYEFKSSHFTDFNVDMTKISQHVQIMREGSAGLKQRVGDVCEYWINKQNDEFLAKKQ